MLKKAHNRKDLTEEQKIEILKLYKSGISRSFLIKKYGIKNAITRLISESGFERTLEERSKQTHYKNLTKETSLKKYGVTHARKSKVFKDKYKQTCLERYGVENEFQLEEIKDKIKETNLERYGVEHNSQNQIFKDKYKQTCLKRYGVENVRQFKPFIDKMQEKKMNNPKGFVQISIMADNLFLNINTRRQRICIF